LAHAASSFGIRTDLRNQIRGVLKTFGIVLSKKGGKALEQQVRELKLGNSMLNEALRALMTVLHSVCEQISRLDRITRQHAKQHVACRHLMGIPGVGPMTAAAFVTAIDDPSKFRKSKSVGAFLGLTPRSYQSGEIDVNGRISKCGDQLARTYLYEAASSLLTRVKKWSALKAWGLRIAKRSGMRKAKVAVARKLEVIMHQMWSTGEEFRWSNAESPAG
jgi:transposase